jgi:hypothetical protein
VAYLEVLSRFLPGETEEMTKNLSQDSRYAGRDLNSRRPEFEVAVLTT